MHATRTSQALMMDAISQAAVDRTVRSMSAVDEGALIDLHRVAGIIRSRLGLIAVVSELILVAIAIASLLAEPRHLAQAPFSNVRGFDTVIQVHNVIPTH